MLCGPRWVRVQTISPACSQSFSKRHTAKRAVLTSLFARLGGVMRSSPCPCVERSVNFLKPDGVVQVESVGASHRTDLFFGNKTSKSVRLGSGSTNVFPSLPSMIGNLPVPFAWSKACIAISAALSGLLFTAA